MWLTMMWHAATGLPWDWRIGPSDSSEREHWMPMLPLLPAAAMIAADAGFVGYEYAREVIASGRSLLLRVGANVRLLRKLGYARESAGLVYLWPDRAARDGQPPLVLRLVVVHNGKHPVYLVSSITDANRLSDEQLTELYRRRWGIEEYHKATKTGCGVEDLQFTAVSRLEPMIAMLSAVALTLLDLRDASRQPNSTSRRATTVVDRDTVAAVTAWRYGKIRLDVSVHDFYLALARLEGHQNRRNDHPLG